ncbi:hypothetical protein MEX01_50620 [Methylorubrum extorquens]|nr:hypothetical protein MEX01_50620 [Methylorubrum extorquens]
MAEHPPPPRRRREATQPLAAVSGPRRTVRASEGWAVVDDLPRPLPIGRAELEVLEMYLGSALDGLLRAMKT